MASTNNVRQGHDASQSSDMETEVLNIKMQNHAQNNTAGRLTRSTWYASSFSGK